MKKLIIVALLLCSACVLTEKPALTEFQITACTAAEKGETCDTHLEGLDIVTKTECCEALSKCCEN